MAREMIGKTSSATNAGAELPRGRSSSTVHQTFAALQYPNYRLWFMGQLSSLVGTWMQMTAQGFLVFQLTNSPTYLGLVGFASGIPSWLLMLYGGVIADRLPRRNLLVVTQTAMMALAFVLAALTFTGWVHPWHIVLLALLLGVANAFDTPARQAFVTEMVDREDLGNAIALNSMMFQSATVVGPAVAGITYALLGPAWCFTINGISFIAVIGALLMMHIKPMAVQSRTTSAWQEMKLGLSYIVKHPVIRTLIFLVGVVSLFSLSFSTLFPDWAVVVLGGDASTNGWLQSARGLGSLVGALMIASLGNFRSKGKLLLLGNVVLLIALIVFAQIRSLPLSLLSLLAVGWGFMVFFNMANILVQTHVEDEFRGRVMGVYSLSFAGLMPVGALFAGAVADQIGAPLTVVAGALITLVFVILVAGLVPRLRSL